MTKAFLPLTLAAFCAAGAALADETIHIGFPPSIDTLPGLVAHENGCLKRAGYDSVLVPTPVVTNIPPALLSGSLQIGISTPTVILPAVENGIDMVAIAGSSVMQKGNEGLSLVTRTGLGITTAKDLEGRKVGVPGLLSVADLVFRKWLVTEGVDPATITFVEVPFPRMAEMMKAGSIDAVVAAEPVLGALVSGGLAERNAGEYYSAVADDALITLWATTGEWARNNPEAVKAFTACLDESIDWIRANRDAAGEIAKTHLNVNPPYTPAWRTAIVPADFDFFVGVGREFDLLTGDVDTKTLVAGD